MLVAELIQRAAKSKEKFFATLAPLPIFQLVRVDIPVAGNKVLEGATMSTTAFGWGLALFFLGFKR